MDTIKIENKYYIVMTQEELDGLINDGYVKGRIEGYQRRKAAIKGDE